MLRGKTEAETLALNGWTVGDVLECGYVQIQIIWVDQSGLWGLHKHKDVADWSDLNPISLDWGEWRKVGRIEPDLIAENKMLRHELAVIKQEYEHMTKTYFPMIIDDLKNEKEKLQVLLRESFEKMEKMKEGNPDYQIDKELRRMVGRLMN